MKCKNCTKYKNDCGHHFKDSNGHINYDCPAEFVCDRYGHCEYYKESRSDLDIALEELNTLVNNGSFSGKSYIELVNYFTELKEYKQKYLDLCK